MSLARITKRIEEQDTKKVKIDGRRFNKRSQQKMIWQVRDLQRGMIKKPHRTGRGSFSKDELEEYKLIKDKDREERETQRAIRNIVSDLIDKVVDDIGEKESRPHKMSKNDS